MLVTIHQPEHLPWLGFFDKARRADLLVLLDGVQFRKNYFQNRNRVRIATGDSWVTIPVLRKGHSDQRIVDVQINPAVRWREKYWGTVEQAYRKTEFWPDYSASLRETLLSETPSLADLNIEIIQLLFRWLHIDVKVVRSSHLAAQGTKSELLLKICQETGANRYLSGISGRDYLDMSLFAAAGVAVDFHEFHHPIYRQRYEPFLPCMAAVDLIFNHGPASPDMLRGLGVEVMKEFFA